MNNLLWTDKEINYLKNNFSDLTNQELSNALNKPIKAITMKAFRLRLKKSKEHIGKQIGKRNKMVGRDLTYDVLVDIASKYKTRGKFQHMDSSAYTVARTKGYLNDICSHMIKTSYSIPQIMLGEIMKNLFGKENVLTNDRKRIKPYELDVYIPKHRLAFEYDGKRWHKNNKNDTIKNKICIEENIKLIRIKENSRNYILDIKNQLINNIDIINNWCNLNIKKQDILSINKNEIYKNINKYILNDDNIYNIVKKYHNYFDFIKNEPNLYVKLIRNNCLDKYTSKLKRSRKKWTMESIKIEISKYKTLKDFTKKSNPCYQYVKRHELDFLIKELDKY